MVAGPNVGDYWLTALLAALLAMILSVYGLWPIHLSVRCRGRIRVEGDVISVRCPGSAGSTSSYFGCVPSEGPSLTLADSTAQATMSGSVDGSRTVGGGRGEWSGVGQDASRLGPVLFMRLLGSLYMIEARPQRGRNNPPFNGPVAACSEGGPSCRPVAAIPKASADDTAPWGGWSWPSWRKSRSLHALAQVRLTRTVFWTWPNAWWTRGNYAAHSVEVYYKRARRRNLSRVQIGVALLALQ
ncbi:hypothetical protein PHYSODRAFT_303546 [Phytophthora sojae]|uniref:Uncharacterized protein n=1 Tax=Phytophthora sojae (strain P6497) TaxID=1094619 RepID=G4ZVN8_PHYSP|nr:hypothetical protein PHYSODRAFT_303546 [Phytophthora sojae]EGZ11503.1 hypothetical protein PHYSODRAFT_303546 [Phytophthora sojae]|eukprot:XP_009531836.1 hypothetical protein PHYSODRAFT_303546 [Phytophthora sojae]